MSSQRFSCLCARLLHLSQEYRDYRYTLLHSCGFKGFEHVQQVIDSLNGLPHTLLKHLETSLWLTWQLWCFDGITQRDTRLLTPKRPDPCKNKESKSQSQTASSRLPVRKSALWSAGMSPSLLVLWELFCLGGLSMSLSWVREALPSDSQCRSRGTHSYSSVQTLVHCWVSGSILDPH